MARASPRYPVRLAATVHVEDGRGSAGDMLICRTQNISREGCLLDTSHSFEAGISIRITIMDSGSGEAVPMTGRVARTIDAPSDGSRVGIGVRIPDPPDAWLALVERQTRRVPGRENDVPGLRQSIVVVGEEDRRRGALALYVTSGWDVRFAVDFASTREALSSGAVDALVVEHAVDDERWRPLLELAKELQPRARRLLRAPLSGSGKPRLDAPEDLVHMVIDQDDGLDALVDALARPILVR